MTKALFKLFILFITCSTAISCSEQDSPELPDNSGNTNQGIASIDQTQINANGGGFIIRVKADGTWQASGCEFVRFHQCKYSQWDLRDMLFELQPVGCG